jgi:hypothetical protein
MLRRHYFQGTAPVPTGYEAVRGGGSLDDTGKGQFIILHFQIVDKNHDPSSHGKKKSAVEPIRV